LVEEEEQITHQTFKFDSDDLGNEKEYTSVKADIQGKDSKEPTDNYSLMYKVETRSFVIMLLPSCFLKVLYCSLYLIHLFS
jgi:hypothetical protein